MKRRNFLKGILAVASIPVLVKAEEPQSVKQPENLSGRAIVAKHKGRQWSDYEKAVLKRRRTNPLFINKIKAS